MEKFLIIDGFDVVYPVYAESKEDFLNKLVIAISKTASKIKVVRNKFKSLTGEEIDSGYCPTDEFCNNPENEDFLKEMNTLYLQLINLENMKVCRNRLNYDLFRDAYENNQIDKDKHILTIDEYFERNTEKE